MRPTILLLLITIVIGSPAMAQELIKLNSGVKITCLINEICKEGVVYTPDGEKAEKQFLGWGAILYIKYKDGSKIHGADIATAAPKADTTSLKHQAQKTFTDGSSLLKKKAGYFGDKIKDYTNLTPKAIDTVTTPPGRAVVVKSEENDTLTIVPIPIPVITKDNVPIGTFLPGDCKDMAFDKGIHDAQAHYLGKRARNALIITNIIFLPAGIITYATMSHAHPHPQTNDMSLLNDASYLQGYKLKASATKKVAMKRGFWLGVGGAFLTTTTLIIAGGGKVGEGGGGGGWHHH